MKPGVTVAEGRAVRDRIIRMLIDGVPRKEIAAAVRRSKSYVKMVAYGARDEGLPVPKLCAGRPSKEEVDFRGREISGEPCVKCGLRGEHVCLIGDDRYRYAPSNLARVWGGQ